MSEPKALGPAILSANYTEFSVSGNFMCIIFVLVSITLNWTIEISSLTF